MFGETDLQQPMEHKVKTNSKVTYIDRKKWEKCRYTSQKYQSDALNFFYDIEVEFQKLK